MTDEVKNEFTTFLIQNSRELGSFGAKLDIIFHELTKQNGNIDSLWKRTAENTQEINGLKIKVMLIAAGISVGFNAPNIVQALMKFL